MNNRQKLVVIIDDSTLFLEMAKAALTKSGLRVKTLLEPDRTEIFTEGPPDLVLVDVNMPEAFGDDVISFLRESYEVEAPMWFYSSLSGEELKERAAAAHADGFICKDWGIECMVELVQGILVDIEQTAPEKDAPKETAPVEDALKEDAPEEDAPEEDAPGAAVPPDRAREVPRASPPSSLEDALRSVSAAYPAIAQPVGQTPGREYNAHAGSSDRLGEIVGNGQPADVIPTPPPPEAAPSGEDDDPSVFTRFARRCHARCDETRAILSAGDEQDEPLEPILLLVHDWIGEAKLIGLDRIAEVANVLKEVVTSWTPTFQANIQGVQLSSWFDLLAELSEDLSVRAPDSGVLQRLKELRNSLQEELESASTALTPTPTHTEGDLPTGTRRILIFDDSPIIREVLAMELEGKGHLVAQAEDLAGFQKALTSFKPEIIFLDINMPEIKGNDLCAQLQEKEGLNQVPVILMSSLPDEELATIARDAGADGYLSKQRGMDDLIEYLDNLIVQIVF